MVEIIKILIVEDDYEIARIMRDHLVREGFQVTWASTGVEGWEEFKEGNFSLVLVDLMMPEMDGFNYVNRFGWRVIYHSSSSVQKRRMTVRFLGLILEQMII